MLTFCLAFNFYWLHSYECYGSSLAITNGTVSVDYYPFINEFYRSDPIQLIIFGENLTQEIICPIILIIINIMTTLFIANNLIKKRRLQMTSNLKSTSLEPSPQMKRAIRAKKRTTQMVLLTSFLTIMGNIPTFIQYKFFFMDACFYTLASIIYYMSYSSSFFVYFFFLKKFRLFYMNGLKKIFQVFRIYKS